MGNKPIEGKRGGYFIVCWGGILFSIIQVRYSFLYPLFMLVMPFSLRNNKCLKGWCHLIIMWRPCFLEPPENRQELPAGSSEGFSGLADLLWSPGVPSALGTPLALSLRLCIH